MSGLTVRNLPYIRQKDPRLYEALQDIQQGVTAGFKQANVNPNGQPESPPAIQSVNATGQNGVLHVSIEHSAAEVSRGVAYYVEHADNPSFNNPQIRNIGDSRSFSEFVGNQDRYVRAYAAYPGSPAGTHAYHGGAASPQPVNGGGAIGPPAYLPSQGAGTGAPGQGGMGPGPVPVRTDSSGFDWRLQQASTRGGFSGTGSPGSQGGASDGTGSGGGGGVVTQGLLVGTHAQRLANYPSVRYPANTEFYESDRTLWYWAQNASGTVTVTTGTTVTWVSGNKFINTGTGFTASQWPAGTQIVINGVTCHVASVSSSTVLTLQTATTNAAGVSYLVPSGRWVYFDGQYAAALASLPADLGENDTTLVSSKVALGVLFFENNAYAHQLQWNVSLWQRGPNDEEHSDTFHEFGAAPSDIGWAPCDGTVGVTYLKYDGTTGTRTVPNSNATAAYYKGGSAYNPALNAPTLPALTMNSYTPAGTVSSTFVGTLITFTTDLFQTLLAGVAALVSPTSTTPTGTVASTFSGTPATLTGTIALPADPVENVAIIKMYRR